MDKKYTIDLHMHSTLSDGNESPCQVVDTAARAGLKKICLTDHDGVHLNYDKVREYAKGRGVEVLPFSGTEVNTLYYDGLKPLVSVHMLVFGDDEKLRDERFISMINKYFAHTNKLAVAQYEKLPEIGVEMTYDELFLIDPDIAPVYKQEMYCASYVMRRAAKKLGVPPEELRAKYPALFPYNLPSRSVFMRRVVDMPDTVELIRLANELGLVTVMAHPSWLETLWEGEEHLRNNVLAEKVIRELAAAGLDGLEVKHQEVVADGACELVQSLAEELGLITTGGSDYHSESDYGNGLGVYGTGEEELAALMDKIREKSLRAAKQSICSPLSCGKRTRFPCSSRTLAQNQP